MTTLDREAQEYENVWQLSSKIVIGLYVLNDESPNIFVFNKTTK